MTSYNALILAARSLAHAPGPAVVLETRPSKSGEIEAYVSFVGQDKRLDTWVRARDIGELYQSPVQELSRPSVPKVSYDTYNFDIAELTRQLKLDMSTQEGTQSAIEVSGEAGPSRLDDRPALSLPSTPEREHATMTRVRNFEDVRVGEYLIKTWYYSPYPLAHADKENDKERHRAESPSLVNGKKRKLDHHHEDTGEERSIHAKVEAGMAMSKVVGGGNVRNLKDAQKSAGVVLGAARPEPGKKGRLWVCDVSTSLCPPLPPSPARALHRHR
jgi:histone acetyltransferase MYST1